MEKKRLYFDMDGVIVDFNSAVELQDEATLKEYEGRVDDVFHKKVIITHCKNLCNGDILIDDRPKHGACEFEGVRIQFGSEKFPDWNAVLDYLL